jgi:hypothetical protein
LPTKIDASPVENSLTSEEFFEAIAAGNSQAAADALRKLDGLGRSDLQLLADLLSGAPVSARLFPYWIKLKKRGAGKPTDYMKNKADAFGFVRLISQELESSSKLDAAIHNVAKTTGKSYSHVRRAWDLWGAKK